MRTIYFVLCFVVAIMMSACDAPSPNEQMSFRNADYTQQVVAKLEKENVPYKKINDRTIVFSVDNSSKVLKAVAEINASAPVMYVIHGVGRKSGFERLLKENNVPYRVESDDEEEMYSFFVSKEHRRVAHELLMQVTKGR